MPETDRALAHANHSTTQDGVVIGIDIGGTKTALMAWDCARRAVLARDTFQTPTTIGPEAMIDQLVAAVDALLAEAERTRADLRAVGVAVPGQVEASSGTVLLAGNLTGWRDVPLGMLLAERLEAAVAVEQDANAAALGERWRGAAQEMQTFVFLALGTGIGAGIVINGQLYRGAHCAAGELGDLVVGRAFLGRERHGQGDLAQKIGGKALRSRARQATGENLSAAEALSRAEVDSGLTAMKHDVDDYLAMTVVAIAAVLDPEAIIMGGGTAEAGERLLDPVRERMAGEVLAPPLLMSSALGTEAQVFGAIFAALQQREAHSCKTDS